MGFFCRLLGRGPRVPADTLGILDLSGGTVAGLMTADRAALAPLFRRVSESNDAPPRSTLLLVYCTIAADGAILNSRRGLREIIRDAGAPVVIVATPNPGRSYTVAANRNKQVARANLVMTLDRNGEAFTRFFQRLVGDMKQGTSMPRAWVKLAPQVPRGTHPDCPEAIFTCELGQLAFS
jgi:hypothetical protein